MQSFIWENEFHKDTGINEYLLTIYSLVDDENDLFERSEEIHHQRAYDIKFVRDCLENAGFSCLEVYDAFTENAGERGQRGFISWHSDLKKRLFQRKMRTNK